MDQNQQTQTYVQDNGLDLHARVNDAFGKGLGATIMSCFPIASIIAIFRGSAAVREINEIRAEANARGVVLSGKNIAARVLGMVGKYAGIAITVYYGIFVSIFVIAYIIPLIAIISSGISDGISMILQGGC